ncbi:unnamed protein product, partial [Prorocentrum cordatum]
SGPCCPPAPPHRPPAAAARPPLWPAVLPGVCTMAEWVAQVKEMQRQDPVAKEQWYAYCESFGNNIRDPAKHDPSFIQSFISQYQQGARLEYKEGQEFVKMIKLGQKKSQAWKGVWEAYCDTRKGADGKSTYDPAKHDIGFLE